MGDVLQAHAKGQTVACHVPSVHAVSQEIPNIMSDTHVRGEQKVQSLIACARSKRATTTTALHPPLQVIKEVMSRLSQTIGSDAVKSHARTIKVQSLILIPGR